MTVNDWFKNGCDYNKGVEIYKALPNANTNFIRIFSAKESMHNAMKLRYELQKYLEPTAQLKSKITPPKRKIQITIDSSAKQPEPAKKSTKYFRKLLLNELPVALHPIYIQQKNDYHTYVSLKLQLNRLSHVTDSFGKPILGRDGLPKLKDQTEIELQQAAKICNKIEDLLDAVDKAWQVIDHYLNTKEVVIIKEDDFADLSPGKVRDKIVSVRGSITRQKQRKKMLSEKLENAVAKKYKIKYQRDLAKCTAKLMQLENDLVTLLNIRNNE